MSGTSSSRTSAKVAEPVALPFLPRWRATRSLAVVAKKSTSTRRLASPATGGEQLVKGKLFMAMQAPSAVG